MWLAGGAVLVAVIAGAVFAGWVLGRSEEPAAPVASSPFPSVPRSNIPWKTHLARADADQLRWEMPEAVGIDGPRALAHIDAPAYGTWWVRTSVTAPLRYDAMLLQELGALGTGESMLLRAVEGTAGAATVEFEPVVQGDEFVEVEFWHLFEQRTFVGYAFAWDDTVFALSVGYLTDEPSLEEQARADLDLMLATFTREPL